MYGNDRRIFERFEVDFPVEVKWPDEQVSRSQCCDVSATGVGLLSEEQLMPRARLELLLDIPDGHTPLYGSARVVWSNQVHQAKWHSGLKFETIDFMGIRRIFDALNKEVKLF